MGCCPWGHKKLDMIEMTKHKSFLVEGTFILKSKNGQQLTRLKPERGRVV